MSRTVLWLSSRKARDRRVAGGKAANLSRLVAFGFPVPPGLVVPVGAMEDEDGRWKEQVLRAASRLRPPLAVRSSLVGEDDIHWSFAGQLETVLEVEGEEELLRALETVRVSGTRLRFRHYGQAETPGGMDRASPEAGAVMVSPAPPAASPDALAMAVLVQEMVPSRAAGVAFSHDPLTGRSTAVLEAVARLGDELVQGRAAPDRFVVDSRGVVLLEERSSLTEEDLPAEVVLQVASMARLAADRFGAPQDVEWAWDGETVFILQSRPITSLAGKNVYSRRLVGDMSPGLVKHLVWSTNTLGMVEGVFGEIFTCLMGKNDYDFKRILRRIRSRAYVDTTFVGELLAELGLPRNLFEAVAREDPVSRRVRLSPKLLSRAPGILAFLWRYARMERELDAVLGKHGRELDRFRKVDWSEETASNLMARADELLALHRHLQRCIIFGTMNLAIRTRLLKRFVARHAPEVDASQLLLGLRGLKSLEPNRVLQAMAVRLGPWEEDVLQLLLSGRDGAIREGLAEHPSGAALLVEVDEFLDRFGYLSANGTNFGEPTWAEEPAPLWMALGRMIREEPRPAKDPGPVREEARRRVLARLGPLQGRRFLLRLASAARYLELREGMSLLMTEDTYELRRLFLALGRRLAEVGCLEETEDVFHLQLHELQALVKEVTVLDDAQAPAEAGTVLDGAQAPAEAGTALNGAQAPAEAGTVLNGAQAPATQGTVPEDTVPQSLRARVRERKAEMEADRQVELPETIVGDEIPAVLPEPEDVRVLTGIPASAGVIRGTARVVKELSDAPAHLSATDVLVVPFSDVGWTPLFATVGGIVAECGGQLSHTAIVAREYGLPAVVGVRGAVQLIRDGQAVMVDGGTGRVYLDFPRRAPWKSSSSH